MSAMAAICAITAPFAAVRESTAKVGFPRALAYASGARTICAVGFHARSPGVQIWAFLPDKPQEGTDYYLRVNTPAYRRLLAIDRRVAVIFRPENRDAQPYAHGYYPAQPAAFRVQGVLRSVSGRPNFKINDVSPPTSSDRARCAKPSNRNRIEDEDA